MLNERIKNLFLNMINSPEKIVMVGKNKIKFDNELIIEYWNKHEEVLDNKPLKLKSCDDNFYYRSMDVDINNHLVFCIATPYKHYEVPDFTDRIEYASVLNTLDKSLALFEDRKLSEYESYYAK